MSLKITFDLLAPGFREASLSIPVHASNPSKGWARVKVKELPKKIWDELWATLQIAERARIDAIKIVVTVNTMSASPLRLAELLETERAAQKAILRACVVGHEASDFITATPTVETDHPDYSKHLSALLAAGFSPESAASALASGVGDTPFVLDPKGGISDATLELYERVSPDRQFVVNLLASIYRFHCGEVLTAGDYWRANRVKEEDIPPPFSRAPLKTE